MSQSIEIFSTDENLVVQFSSISVVSWYEDVTTIIDLDKKGRLLGIEVFLYEEIHIDFEKVREQFQANKSIDTREYGLLYVTFVKAGETPRGSGFGRKSKLGVNKKGDLSLLVAPWNAPGAGIPSANPDLVLMGFNYTKGPPRGFLGKL